MTKRKPDLLEALKYAIGRLAYHSDGCRGEDLAYCKCSDGVAIRKLDKVVKAHDPEWMTEIEVVESHRKKVAP